MKKSNFLWDVRHPEHEPVRVEAPDRLRAIAEAAHAWGITMWTGVAHGCEARKIGPAPVKKLPQKKSRRRNGVCNTVISD